jgi:hypothetical protein
MVDLASPSWGRILRVGLLLCAAVAINCRLTSETRLQLLMARRAESSSAIPGTQTVSRGQVPDRHGQYHEYLCGLDSPGRHVPGLSVRPAVGLHERA